MEEFIGKTERANYQRMNKKTELIKAYHQACDIAIEKAVEEKEAVMGKGVSPLLCRMGIHSYTKHTTFTHPAWWDGCNKIINQVSICRREGCRKAKVADITSYHDDW